MRPSLALMNSALSSASAAEDTTNFICVAQGVDGAVEADWIIVAGYPLEEVMACGATLFASL